MFLKTNSVNVSLREYLYEGGILLKPVVFLIAVLVKLFRIPVPGSTDIPPVRVLSPFKTTEEELPVDIAATLAGQDAELEQAEFQLTDALAINDTFHNTRYASLVYLSASGDCVAWLRDRRWPQLPRSSQFPRVAFFSRGQNGKVVMTTSAHRDLLDPPDWDVLYKTRSSVAELLEAHRLHVSSTLGAQRPQIAADALTVLDDLQRQFVEYQLGRGVFAEPDPADAVALAQADKPESVATSGLAQQPTTAALDPLSPVIEEVRRLETKRTQWMTKLIVLVASVAVFVGLGAAQWDLKLVLMLVPILFVHELGHFIAMLIFGYKNVQMFYIPLLGAAVTGRHYQVAGWKKALVSLAGPLPSIMLGLMLGALGVFYDSELLVYASVLTLILNVFNLLPFLPLDGGWVAHVTLFARSQVLDLLFRIGTIAVLLGSSILLGDKILMFFGIAMAIGIPVVWKTMKATEIAKQQTFPDPTDDKIPEAAIRQIVSAIQQAGIPVQGAKQLAQTAVNVYDSVTTQPPSWPATIGIWMLHGGGVMLALVGGIALSAASFLKNELLDEPEFRTHYVNVDFSDGQFRLGTDPLPATDLLMWDYSDPQSAAEAFAQLRDRSDDSVARLGTLVIASRPEAAMADISETADEGFSEVDYSIRLEQRCRSDSRFSDAPPATRQRLFGPNAWGYPSVLVSFAKPHQAEEIVEAMRHLPGQMDERFPIAPWTPRKEITAEQKELRRLLSILQGNAQQLPWIDDAGEMPEPELLSPDDMKKLIQAGLKRHQQNQQRRGEWIANETQNASGAKLQLLQAYSSFESDQQEWRENMKARQSGDDDDHSNPDEKPATDPPELPLLATYLDPILPKLGYLDASDPMHRFAAMANAMHISEDDFDKPPPLRGSLVQINIYGAQDAAASLGGVIAWLKQHEATGLVWSYDQTVLPEDQVDEM